MSGHVPKFGGSNAANFTEVFTLARGGGKAGSGDSAASSQPEESGNGPVYSGRGGGSGGGGRGGAPPRRESGSTRSSQEGSNRPSPPGRREPREPREPREQSSRTGVRGSQDKGSRSHHAPRNDEYAGASHLPKFGEWNAGEGDTNYTVMFTAASKERKTGVAADDTPMKGSGDPQSNSSRIPKKQSSCWSCF